MQALDLPSLLLELLQHILGRLGGRAAIDYLWFVSLGQLGYNLLQLGDP